MKSLRNIPVNLLENEVEGLAPPGSGLVVAVGVSLIFWVALLVWLF